MVAKSFGVALVNEGSGILITGPATLLVAEVLRDYPEYVWYAVGLIGLYNLVSTALDYPILSRRGASSSAKVNTLYGAMSLFTKKHHSIKTFFAETGTVALNLAGVSPDLSGMIANYLSITAGDPNFFLAQRASSSLLNFFTQIPFSLRELRKLKTTQADENFKVI